MLPQKFLYTLALAILVLCVNCEIVKATNYRSNIWHDGPINCYSCDSEEECSQGKGVIRKCENNDAQTCVSVFNELGVVSQRGCSDIITASQYNSYCSSNPDKCPTCLSSGCNEATSLDQYEECISCDSSIDGNCVLKPSEITTTAICYGGCMTALYPTSDSSNPSYNLVRSCLNERDQDDQENCKNGSEEKCVGCTGAKCNVVELPADRHSCYHCLEECEEVVVEKCTTFKDEDQCFMRFEAGSVVEMGCLSEFNNEEAIIELVKEKALLICDDIECNSFENLPRTYECNQCNSATSEACATKPVTITTQSRCSVMPYTQCYQRINGLATYRGCLSDLDGDQFYNCLTGTDSKCKICDGNGCNDEIIPSDRLTCQRCDSESDTNCHTSPSASSVCPSYIEGDACVAIYESGITKRGCQSEFSCDKDSKNCQICSTTDCNTANIKKRVEEIYGIFQDLPLNCNTCSGDDCKNGPLNPNKCEGDNYQDCLTIFGDDGQVLRRGCENLVLSDYETYCFTNPELCFHCKSNGCNDITDSSNSQVCLYCDASSNPDCLFKPSAITTTRRCSLGCVSSLYPRKSDPTVSDFVRTCFEDIEPDNRETCTEDENCLKCTGDMCNDAILPAEGRLKCYHCNGDDCDQPQLQECLGFAADDQCYIYFDNSTLSVIRSGCRSEIARSDILADVKQYFICDGDECNTYSNLPEAKFCFACNSSDDVNCAVDPLNVKDTKRCQTYPYTECYTQISDDGHTQRGCLYDLPLDKFISCNNGDKDSKCRICADDECNKNIYPSSRQQCFRCDSTTDPSCEQDPATVQACPLFNENDSCVTQWTNGITRRGCASEISCEDLGRKNCRQCSGNGCNDINLAADDIGTVGLFTDLPLTCLHCSGDECQESNGVYQVCQGNKQQTCTVAFDAEGNVVERGCSDSLDSVCEDNACYDCKSNGCNNAKSQSDYIDCVFCDAQNGDECTFNVNAITRTRKCYKSCMSALYPRTTDESPVYELARTCLDDKDLDDRELCESSNDAKCKSCTGENCNKDDIGSRKSCYQCQGDGCQNAQFQTCRAVMDSDQCFVQYDENHSAVEFGCKSKYDTPEVQILIKAQHLWLCDDDNCNSYDNLPLSQTCVVCDSRSDNNCAVSPSGVQSTTSCSSLPYSQCYSRVLENGHISRGCLSDLEDEEFYNCLNNKNATECESCVGDKCNSKIYPTNRPTCQVCSSSSLDTCETTPNSSQICLIYTADEKCVTSIDNNGYTVRGCSSQVTCDESDYANCQICQGNDCNVANLKRKADGKPGQWQELPLTCFACTSVDDCKSVDSQLKCSEEEYCMTVFDVNGEVSSRGCSNAIEATHGAYCDVNSANCFNCNSNSCNSASTLGDYTDCIYCDSESNAECTTNPSAVGNRRKCKSDCMTALYPLVNSSVYEVVRSCLDDKDIADQEICSAGASAECKSCSGAACNNHLLPENRLSCLACSGSSCGEPQSSQCLKYTPNDQCYMLFNELSDIVQLGCVSDLEESFVSNNIHRLYMCSERDDCNDFGNIPQTTMCAECDSRVDSDCASLPENVPSVTQCTALPNTQCYTRVNTDGSTVRGCVSSLSQTQMLTCLSGNSSDCTTCEGDRCNIQIFPADRRRCQRCNTKDDPGCESSPDFGSVCPVFSANQFCATKLVNGHTYRGCSDEFQCDDSDKQYCRLCHGSDNCNFVDLASSNIGYPGKWQGVPINCYTCQGADCQNSLGVVRKCENNNQQNCATVFATNGTVVERGCSDNIYNGDNLSHCDENPSFCKFCKSSGCNKAINLSNYQDCLFCDGTENPDCIFDPENIKRTRSCYNGCVTGLYPRNQTEVNPAYELARGCLDDLDLDDLSECEEGTKPNCQTCDEASCNNVKIPQTRLRCNVCNGDDCDEPQIAECTAYRENDQCFTLFSSENNVQRMGCASDLDNWFLFDQRRHLLLCTGDECNNFDFPAGVSCRVCNSIANPECASDKAFDLATVCHLLPNTECFTRIDKDGATHRGCLSDIDDDLFDDCTSGNSSTCEICKTNGCNSQTYPAERRSCIQCDSNQFSACEDNSKQFAQTCAVYKENDSCVTKLEGERTIRGCSSEFTCDTSNRDSCRICSNTDDCNTVNLLTGFIGEPGKWQGLPLNCYNCEGEECNDSNGLLNVCQGNNLQTCSTVFGLNGSVVKRGCSDDVANTYNDFCDEHPDRCLGCKSNGCNNVKNLEDYIDCYFCDSATSASCSIDFSAASGKTRKCQDKCMVALYPRNSADNPVLELTRTCLDDMDLDDRDACVNGENDFCKACTGSLCNTMKVPEERFECYKCLTDDCEDVISQECSGYLANDQCYTLFNNESSIIAMGCRSEFEMNAVTELVKQKQMLLCDSKNCNSPELIPTAKQCSVCNSDENSLCATNPNLVANIERCSSLPYTDCYTRVNAYGHTERGCLGSLESETFYACLKGNDSLCETCTGDKCNEIDVFPGSRQTCQQCSSSTDPLCSSEPNSNKVCPLYVENDSCVTNFRNGITTRGCSSTMKCDNENDKRTCRICDSNGCNIVNLEKTNENGEPGRWQDIPITCYTCKGDEDCETRGDLRVCVNNPYQNCMTVFNAEDKVIQRGCSDIVEADNESYCEANPARCMACNSNGCNVAKSLEDYVECLYCDADSNGACIDNTAAITPTRKCFGHCMTALYPLFEEENPSYGLSRSCYDDMDLDDRDSCAAGNKEYCQTCADEKCNTIEIPSTRRSCYICAGDSCQDPKTQQCPTFRPDDKCYVRFDEKQGIVEMGCRSQFSNADADYLLKQKRLYLCEEENCNHYDNLPSSQTCALCNSRTDSNCAVKPSDVTGRTTCAVLPFTECYSRVLSDGATERGCLSNLYDDEFTTCLDGTSTNCKSCKGNDCNKDVFPESRLMCHTCDSTNDPTCESSPNSLGVCSSFDAEDTCVTSFRNDITYRGCSSSLVCDVTNPRQCLKCSGNGCNTVNLKEKQDDNYGKWQDLPLTCLSCTGDECESPDTVELLTCQLNNEQDCMTVFDTNGKVVRRGCADIVETTYGSYCSENKNNCFACKSNQCNNAESKNEFVECVYCDTNKDLECLWNPSAATHKTRQCQGDCMTALYPSDSSTSPAYDLVRTCLNDKEVNEQNTCSDNKDVNCKSCLEGKCNVDNIPESRLSCYTCEGESCGEPETKICPLYKELDQCFIRFDDTNSVSEMGCVSSFRNQQLENIIKTKRVLVCSGPDCNSLDTIPRAQQCVVCDSTYDVSCAVKPVEIGTFETCSMLPYTGCYSKLTETGTTERGCLTNLPEDNFAACVLGSDEKCDSCIGEGCNREIFPANRQQCFTCSSDEEPNCESYPTSKMACPIVSETEACMTALSGNITVRGCKSNIYCDANDSDTCRACYENECNSIDLLNRVDDGYHGVWQELPLKCHTCAGEHCEVSLGPALTCSSRNINQDCMTVFKSNGQVDRRGCSDDVEDYSDLYCRENPDLCFRCKSNECNMAWSVSEYVECIFCDSSNDPLCKINSENAGLGSRKCYKECLVAMKNQTIIRSCLDDKELRVQHLCQESGSQDCAACTGPNCNKFVFPADRLKCHVCTGSSCTSSTGQYCELYSSDDFCFAKYEEGRVDLLGCASSQNASDISDWISQNKLYKCEENDCNELSRLPSASECLSCDSRITPNCAQNPSVVTTSENCNIPGDKCVTTTNSEGHTIRGCFSSLNESEQTCVNNGTCAACSGSKCNNEIFPANRRSCHICNSVANRECAENPNSPLLCLIYVANDSCVSSLGNDGVLTRGCASQVACENVESDYCDTCTSDNCNTVHLKGSAAFTKHSLMLITALAGLALILLNRN